MGKFLREHPIGMLLFAIGTGLFVNSAYDELKGRAKAPVPAERIAKEPTRTGPPERPAPAVSRPARDAAPAEAPARKIAPTPAPAAPAASTAVPAQPQNERSVPPPAPASPAVANAPPPPAQPPPDAWRVDPAVLNAVRGIVGAACYSDDELLDRRAAVLAALPKPSAVDVAAARAADRRGVARRGPRPQSSVPPDQLRSAIEDFQEAVRLDPSAFAHHGHLAEMLARSGGRPEELQDAAAVAIQLMNSPIRMNAVWTFLAEAYRRSGNKELAAGSMCVLIRAGVREGRHDLDGAANWAKGIATTFGMGDLNAAIDQAAEQLRRRWPSRPASTMGAGSQPDVTI